MASGHGQTGSARQAARPRVARASRLRLRLSPAAPGRGCYRRGRGGTQRGRGRGTEEGEYARASVRRWTVRRWTVRRWTVRRWTVRRWTVRRWTVRRYVGGGRHEPSGALRCSGGCPRPLRGGDPTAEDAEVRRGGEGGGRKRASTPVRRCVGGRCASSSGLRTPGLPGRVRPCVRASVVLQSRRSARFPPVVIVWRSVTGRRASGVGRP